MIGYLSRLIAKDPAYKDFKIPSHYKKTVRLVGASRGSLTHDQIREMNRNPELRIKGPIYSNPQYQNVITTPESTIRQAR